MTNQRTSNTTDHSPHSKISTHYVDALLSFAERLLKRRVHKGAYIDRSSITNVVSGSDTSLSIPVRIKDRRYDVVHLINTKWTIERNGWEIANKTYLKISK